MPISQFAVSFFQTGYLGPDASGPFDALHGGRCFTARRRCARLTDRRIRLANQCPTPFLNGRMLGFECGQAADIVAGLTVVLSFDERPDQAIHNAPHLNRQTNYGPARFPDLFEQSPRAIKVVAGHLKLGVLQDQLHIGLIELRPRGKEDVVLLKRVRFGKVFRPGESQFLADRHQIFLPLLRLLRERFDAVVDLGLAFLRRGRPFGGGKFSQCLTLVAQLLASSRQSRAGGDGGCFVVFQLLPDAGGVIAMPSSHEQHQIVRERHAAFSDQQLDTPQHEVFVMHDPLNESRLQHVVGINAVVEQCDHQLLRGRVGILHSVTGGRQRHFHGGPHFVGVRASVTLQELFGFGQSRGPVLQRAEVSHFRLLVPQREPRYRIGAG